MNRFKNWRDSMLIKGAVLLLLLLLLLFLIRHVNNLLGIYTVTRATAPGATNA